MLAWVLIGVLWVGLLSLILHDVTKHEADGSAVSKAAQTSAALFRWVAQKLWLAVKSITSPLQRSSPSSNGSRQDTPPAIEEAPRPPPKKMWRSRDLRVSITAAKLELKIAEAVKSAPGCEDFIGVVVQPKTPKARLNPNWEVRGVKFGNADRKMANEALATVVGRLQLEFRLADHHQGGLAQKVR